MLPLQGVRLISRLDFTAMPNGQTLTDDTGKIWTPNGGSGVSSGQLVMAPNTTDYFTTPDHADWNFGADEFCIEMIGTIASGTTREAGIVSKWSSGWSWYAGTGPSAANLGLYIHLQGGSNEWPVGAGIVKGAEAHFAWYRNASGQFWVAVNGSAALIRATATPLHTSTDPVRIGPHAAGITGVPFSAKQMRVRRGLGCAYSGTSFTPPGSL
ncbi:hypothetical protein [Pseudoxanthomonas jiangsuensis]|uniref:hypothetical protein n=1 Tax=Pseudoxanthomonas jiangsuensis TaxID=619688 RepID=UPI0013916AAB|nr:hypothetical protein [Pseudoxanthomonas jiangsuensis]